MPPAAQPDNEWHLDKKVPLALILAFVAQTFVFGTLLGSFSTRVATLEEQDRRFETALGSRSKLADDRWELVTRDRDRLVRVEEAMKFIADGVRRIEVQIEKAADVMNTRDRDDRRDNNNRFPRNEAPR